MQRLQFSLILGAILASATTLDAADPVLELKVGDDAYVGCAVAHDDQVCWLAQADGRLTRVSVPAVTSFRKVDDEFCGLTALEARNTLRRQLGPAWKIVGTGHYLVCTTTDRGQQYARHFEDLYRSFTHYFSRRGFELPEPKFPLIAMVFADRDDFAGQCQVDKIFYVPGLRGYYHRLTNRISLFEDEADIVQSVPGTRPVPFTLAKPSRSLSISELPVPVDASIRASFEETIVHEATHQLAFNLGLHSRIAQPPRWVVEGLATMFEGEGTRGNTGGRPASERVNRQRLWWFHQYCDQTRQSGSLVKFISTEDAVRRSVLDFYAEAWALTFFLAETRPREYAQYLQRIAGRDPLVEYRARDRLRDFQAHFGTDISRLEAEMLRFIDDL